MPWLSKQPSRTARNCGLCIVGQITAIEALTTTDKVVKRVGDLLVKYRTLLLLPYFFKRIGAPTRTRTADLLITNQLLYQLSYRGTLRRFKAGFAALQVKSSFYLLVRAKLLQKGQQG